MMSKISLNKFLDVNMLNTKKYYRLFLTVVLIFAVGSFWYTRFDELVYHTIGSSNLINIGDAVDFSVENNQVKPNSYVEVSGVLGNKAATLRGLRAGSLRYGKFQVRNLLGSKLFIEFDQDKYFEKFNRPFVRVNITGRLIDFSKNSELRAVRDFYKNHYDTIVDEKAMIIVVDEKPRNELKYPLLFLLSIILVVSSIFHSLRAFLKQ